MGYYALKGWSITSKNLVTTGLLHGNKKYEGVSVTTKNLAVDFILKKLSLISFVMIYPKNIRAKEVSLKHVGLK